MQQEGCGVYESRHAYEQEVKDEKYFWQVIKSYQSIREMSPISAFNYDPDKTQSKLTISLVVFLADVDIVTSRILGKSGFDQWKELVAGAELPQATVRQIIKLCSKAYKKSGLAPVSYFKAVRKGRPRRGALLATAGAA